MTAHPPRVAIGAIMKNEAPYVVEWVAWYRLLGFEIFIADNGGDDGQTELLQKLEAAGYITTLDVRPLTRRPQVPAYAALVHTARDAGIAYLGLLDGDEFFEPIVKGLRPGAGAELIIEEFQLTQCHAMGFNWLFFGSSHQETSEPEPVTSRFSWAADKSFEPHHFFKSFLDVSKCMDEVGDTLVQKIHPHGIAIPKEFYLHDGESIDLVPGWGKAPTVHWNKARVRHYVIKSRQEFLNKQKRGDACATPEEMKYQNDFFEHHDKNDVFEPLDEGFSKQLSDMMASIESKLDTIPELATKSVDIVTTYGVGHLVYEIHGLENQLIADLLKPKMRHVFTKRFWTYKRDKILRSKTWNRLLNQTPREKK